VGRLERRLVPTRVDHVAAHANRHAYPRSARFSCQPQHRRPAHATTTGALAHVVGRATGTQCLLLACALGGASPLRHSKRLCPFCGLDESVKGDDRKLGAALTESSRRALGTLRGSHMAAFTACLLTFHLCRQRLCPRLFSLSRPWNCL